jgi:hypothetical protein
MCGAPLPSALSTTGDGDLGAVRWRPILTPIAASLLAVPIDSLPCLDSLAALGAGAGEGAFNFFSPKHLSSPRSPLCSSLSPDGGTREGGPCTRNDRRRWRWWVSSLSLLAELCHLLKLVA